MNQYEAVAILKGSLGEDEIVAGLADLNKIIESLGGVIQGTTRMGRKVFAREMQKQTAGEYALLKFNIDGVKIKDIHTALEHSETMFRLQIIKLNEKAGAA